MFEPPDPDDDWPIGRLCGHPNCSKVVPDGWAYEWCETCCNTALCRHNNRPAECDECDQESDRLFDEMRENRLFGDHS